MKKALKATKAGLITTGLLVCGLNTLQAQDVHEDLFSSPFDACFDGMYNVADASKEQAFKTAECFNGLLESKTEAGASMETLLQYSASWYQAAAEKGHELGLVRLESTLLAIGFLEFGAKQGQQKLASEKIFESLDSNKDGLLNAREFASNNSLEVSFQETDFDQDGLLSFGEFAISAGEATAAGN